MADNNLYFQPNQNLRQPQYLPGMPQNISVPTAVSTPVISQSEVSNYQKLDDGTYVDKGFYDKLSKADQIILKTKGVDYFNNYKQTQQIVDVNKYYVQLSDGTYIDRETFNALPVDVQNELYTLGVEKYNAKIEQQRKDILAQQAQFERDNVHLGSGEWVDRKFYDSLSPDDQQLLYDLGVTEFSRNHYWGGTVVYQPNYDAILASLTPVQLSVYDWSIAHGQTQAQAVQAVIDYTNALNITPNVNIPTPSLEVPTTLGGHEIITEQHPEFIGYVSDLGNINAGAFLFDKGVTASNIENLQSVGISNEYINQAATYATNLKALTASGSLAQYFRDNGVSEATIKAMQSVGYSNADIDKATRASIEAPIPDFNDWFRAKYGEEYDKLVSEAVGDLMAFNKANPNSPPMTDARLISRKPTELFNRAAAEYAAKYGEGAFAGSELAPYATMVFAPARALRPDVDIKNITGGEWALGVAQILGTIALGAGGGVVGKVLMYGSQAAFATATALEWGSLNATQKALSITAIVLPVTLDIASMAAGKAAAEYVKKLTPAEQAAKKADELTSELFDTGLRKTTSVREVLGVSPGELVNGRDIVIGEIVTTTKQATENIAASSKLVDEFISKVAPEIRPEAMALKSAADAYAEAYARYEYLNKAIVTTTAAEEKAAQIAISEIEAQLPILRQNLMKAVDEFNDALHRAFYIEGNIDNKMLANDIERTIADIFNPSTQENLMEQLTALGKQLDDMKSAGQLETSNYADMVAAYNNLEKQINAYRVSDYQIVKVEIAQAKAELADLLNASIPDADLVAAKRLQIVKLEQRLADDVKAIIGESGTTNVKIGGGVAAPPVTTIETPTITAGIKTQPIVSTTASAISVASQFPLASSMSLGASVETAKPPIPEIALPSVVFPDEIESESGATEMPSIRQAEVTNANELQSVSAIESIKRAAMMKQAQITGESISPISAMQIQSQILQQGQIQSAPYQPPQPFGQKQPQPLPKTMTEQEIQIRQAQDYALEEEINNKITTGKPLNKKEQKKLKDLKKRKQYQGAITFQHGFGWVALKEPYYPPDENIAFFYGHPPAGAQIVQGGKGAAYRSIQMYLASHDLPDIHFQRGIMKIHITKATTKEPGAIGAIRFETTQRGRDELDIIDTPRVQPVERPQQSFVRKSKPPSGFQLG